MVYVYVNVYTPVAPYCSGLGCLRFCSFMIFSLQTWTTIVKFGTLSSQLDDFSEASNFLAIRDSAMTSFARIVTDFFFFFLWILRYISFFEVLMILRISFTAFHNLIKPGVVNCDWRHYMLQWLALYVCYYVLE